MGKGRGMGYKNIVPRDPFIHGLSAKGVKTIFDKTPKKELLKLKKVRGMDSSPYVTMEINQELDNRKMSLKAMGSMSSFKVDREYTINAWFEPTSRGFRHVAVLMRGSSEIEKATANYLNRTWESYTYQSVLRKVLRKHFTDEKKADTMISKLEKKRRLFAKGNLTTLDKWKKLPKDYKKDVSDLEKEIEFLKADDERLRKRSFKTYDKYAQKGINSERNAIWRKIENREEKLSELNKTKLSKKQVAFLKKNFRELGDQKKVERIYGATTRTYVVKLSQGKFQVDDDYLYGVKGSPRVISIERVGKK